MEIYRRDYRKSLVEQILAMIERRGGLLSAAVLGGSLALGGCSDDDPRRPALDASGPVDAAQTDGAPRDAGRDGGRVDAFLPMDDASVDDGGSADAAPMDAGSDDGGPPDAGPVDAGPMDAGPPDAGPMDAGPPDAGPVDAGSIDAGPGPFRLLSARFTSTSNVRLTFSEALGPVSAVAPSQFRLSFGRGYQYTSAGTYAYGTYSDLGYAACEAYYVEYNASYAGLPVMPGLLSALDSACMALPFPPPLVDVTALTAVSGAPAQLDLTLTPGVDATALPSLCGTAPNARYCAGVAMLFSSPPPTLDDCAAAALVHHQAGAAPVRSSTGTPLGNFGGTWAGSATPIDFLTSMPVLSPERVIACP